ncbi:MAG: GNAT family N-acetyltransferase [Phormidesmis sp.]
MVDFTIRSIEVSDCEALCALQRCPKVRQGTLKMPYRTVAETRRQLEQRPETMYQLVAVQDSMPQKNSSAQIVGVVSLAQMKHSRQHVGYVGMAVHDDYHNQGIGSQLLKEAINIADDWLNLQRVELTVFIDNAPAIHLYKKFGFVIEGTLKKYAFRAGNYIDAYTMARIV